MRDLPNPICNASQVGKRVPIDPSRGLNTVFHVEDGTAQIDVAPSDMTATPAERAMGRKTVRMQVLPPPPYAIDVDTKIIGGIFRQETPHTVLFSLVPGVKLVIQGDGQYVNCTLPDAAEIVGFPNLSHGVEVAVPGERGSVRLLCECSKCCTAQAELDELREAVKDMNWIQQSAIEVPMGVRDADGRRVHSRPGGKSLKERFRARRLDAVKVSADRTRAAAANLAALRKHDPTGQIRTALHTTLKRGE